MTNDRIDARDVSKNTNIVETHGCIVCARLFTILAVYNPEGRLVDCAVTSPGGHRVIDECRPLVACDTHPARKIEAAYKRWKSRKGEGSSHEPADERDGGQWTLRIITKY